MGLKPKKFLPDEFSYKDTNDGVSDIGSASNLKDRSENYYKISEYFYRVENHDQLNKIGKSFEKDYANGVKSFAITSTEESISKQNTILGIASYFDHLANLNVLIVTNETRGPLGDFHSQGKKMFRKYETHEKHEVSYTKYHESLDFVSFRELIKMSQGKRPTKDYEIALDIFLEAYDLIIWDVPSVEEIAMDKQLYYTVSLKFESLSVVVSKSKATGNKVKKIVEFFENYGVPLKGLIYSES